MQDWGEERVNCREGAAKVWVPGRQLCEEPGRGRAAGRGREGQLLDSF